MYFQACEIFEEKGLGGSSHGSTITQAPDGTLYAVWYSGTAEKAKDVKIYFSMRSKGGSWARPWMIEKENLTSSNPFICGDEDPEDLLELQTEITSEGNPVIYYDDTRNALILFWVTMRGAGDASGWSACIIKVKESFDNGQTWTKPRVIRDMIGWMIRNTAVKLSNGDVILPIMAEFTEGLAMIYRITPEELKKGMQDAKIEEPTHLIKGNVSQPSIVEVAPGKLVCVMRTNKNSKCGANLMAVSESEDYGKTWSEIHPSQDKLENPDSGLDMARLTNGNIVLVCNPNKNGREQITVCLSEDDGKTFPIRRDLEPIEEGKSYSYPSIIVDEKNVCHCTYTNRRVNIKYVSFDEEWIRSGPQWQKKTF